jgi:hypothetical protein
MYKSKSFPRYPWEKTCPVRLGAMTGSMMTSFTWMALWSLRCLAQLGHRNGRRREVSKRNDDVATIKAHGADLKSTNRYGGLLSSRRPSTIISQPLGVEALA